MRRTPFYNFFIVALLVTMTASVSAQQVDSKLPWSVRLTESEMIRYPESWQLDFQPKLKWDYCHGLMATRKFAITPSRMGIQWCTKTEALPLIN